MIAKEQGPKLPREVLSQLPTLVIGIVSRTVSVDGRFEQIKGKFDWPLLLFLASKPNQDIAASEIRKEMKKVGSQAKTPRNYIFNLRKLIEKDPYHPTIITAITTINSPTVFGLIRSVKYRLNANVQRIDGFVFNAKDGFVEKRKKGKKDLGKQEEKVLYALFTRKEDKSGFEHVSLRDVALCVYGKKLLRISNPKVKERITQQHVDTFFPLLQRRVIAKLEGAWTLPLDNDRPRLAKAIRWLKEQPEYANAALDELILVVERKISFEELKKKVSSK